MDWVSLIAALLAIFKDCQAKGEFSTASQGVAYIRNRPLLAKLAIRRALKDQGLHGMELHQAARDAFDELDIMSDAQLLGYVQQVP